MTRHGSATLPDPARRRCIAGAAVALAVPGLALAQAAPAVPIVGILAFALSNDDSQDGLAQMRRHLGDLGWSDGKNLRIEGLSASGRPERLALLARQLVERRPAVIVALGGRPTRELLTMTREIPLVAHAMGADPAQAGLVASLARPGGNLTGTTLASDETLPKAITLLREAGLPAKHLAVLLSPEAGKADGPMSGPVGAAVVGVGVQVTTVRISGVDGVEKAFARLRHARVDSVMVVAGADLEALGQRIATQAIRHRLPSIAQQRSFADDGVLIVHVADIPTLLARAAAKVDQILRGARPGELPIERPTRFRLIVNAKTAKAIGAKLPQSVLLRADEVIR